MRLGRACLSDWPLDPGLTYLNHGTVGVTPLAVLRVQRDIRDRVERAPAQFLLREQASFSGSPPGRPSAVRQAAAAVAAYVGAAQDDLVFVDNATTGANAVLRSFPFAGGDEVLVTDHAYGAVVNAARHIAHEKGAVVRTVSLPYPEYSPAAAVAAVLEGVTPRTVLAIVDHVTSESALVLPVARLVSSLHERGVRVLVDGAHAPGVLPLDLPALGADWYVANLHKWACAPRSCGFLWAPPASQAGLHPVVISWGLDQGFTSEFDWVGTRDVSAWLAAPAGIAFLDGYGAEAVWAHNHGLAWQGASLLAEAWGTVVPAAESDAGFMVTVAAPDAAGSLPADAARLRDRLLFEHRIEVQVHAAAGRVWIRIGAQVYNELDDVARLARAVKTLTA